MPKPDINRIAQHEREQLEALRSTHDIVFPGDAHSVTPTGSYPNFPSALSVPQCTP